MLLTVLLSRDILLYNDNDEFSWPSEQTKIPTSINMQTSGDISQLRKGRGIRALILGKLLLLNHHAIGNTDLPLKYRTRYL